MRSCRCSIEMFVLFCLWLKCLCLFYFGSTLIFAKLLPKTTQLNGRLMLLIFDVFLSFALVLCPECVYKCKEITKKSVNLFLSRQNCNLKELLLKRKKIISSSFTDEVKCFPDKNYCWNNHNYVKREMCLELKFCVVCSPYFKYYKHSVVEAESSQNNLAAFLERFFTCKNFSLYITRRHFLLYSPSNPTTHCIQYNKLYLLFSYTYVGFSRATNYTLPTCRWQKTTFSETSITKHHKDYNR